MKRALRLAVIAAGLTLLGGVPAAQADLRVTQNYRLTEDSAPGRGKDMIALAVNPSNPKHIVATNANYLTQSCEGTASFDGGVTWSSAFALQPPAPGMGLPFMPTCRISNHLAESMFQTVAFGTGQNVYATAITPRSSVGPAGEEGATTLIFKSTDGGVTWGEGVPSMVGGASGSPYYELPSLAVDPGAGTGGADRIYSVARETTGFENSDPPCPTTCPSVRSAVSNDGGQTFAAPVQVSPPGVAIAGPDTASNPVISPDHSVTVAWRTLGNTGSVQIARSTNAGATWSAPVTVTDVMAGGLSGSNHTVPSPSTGSTFPRMAVDKHNGNLYIVYNQGPPGPITPAGGYEGADHFINAASHVYFQRSFDDGATWSTPKLVNDNTPRPGANPVQTRHPSVSVAPDGRVDVVWQDRRHWYQGPGEHNCLHTHVACDDARLGDTYYAYSNNSGTSFTERRISDRSHNNDVGYDYRFGTGWAFGPQAVSMSNDELLIGWMDSREGNVDNDNQDIYLAKVLRGASSTVPQTRVDQPDPAALSVALSKHAYPGGGEGVLASTFATRPATKVVIANQSDVAGALAGGVLARAFLGPVLLSSAGGLSAGAKAEVARLRPIGAYVIGDTSQLSDQVVTDLTNAGVAGNTITRVSGGSTAATAASIAAQFDRRTDVEKAAHVPAFDAAVIANPAGPDAVAAAGLAAARRLPILYTDAGGLPAATSAALASLDIDKTLVIGGTGQVGSGVEAALQSGSRSPDRLGGADQYATSRAVLHESRLRGLPDNVVYVADGNRPMDAALVGPAVGRTTGLLALTPGSPSQNAPATASAADLSGVDRFVVVEATAPAAPPPPPPPPPPPAAAPPPPPPPPAAAVKRRKGKLSATVTPSSDRRAPFRFRTSGKLTLPKGITRAVGCTGRVSVQVKRGGTTISTRRVSLRKDCTYRSTVSFATSKRFGRTIKRLRFTARFLGNTRVAPVTAKSRYVRVRR